MAKVLSSTHLSCSPSSCRCCCRCCCCCRWCTRARSSQPAAPPPLLPVRPCLSLSGVRSWPDVPSPPVSSLSDTSLSSLSLCRSRTLVSLCRLRCTVSGSAPPPLGRRCLPLLLDRDADADVDVDGTGGGGAAAEMVWCAGGHADALPPFALSTATPRARRSRCCVRGTGSRHLPRRCLPCRHSQTCSRLESCRRRRCCWRRACCGSGGGGGVQTR